MSHRSQLIALLLVALATWAPAQTYQASSSERDDLGPAKAFDGDGDSRWSASFKEKTAWIQVSFADEQSFDSIVILSGIRDLKGAPKDFEILAGADDSSLRSLKQVRGNDQNRVEVKFKKTRAKVWRVDIQSLINDRWSPTLTEISFPGAESSEASAGPGRYSASAPGLPSNEVEKAFDGDHRTRYENSDRKTPVWIQVSLEEALPYDGVQIRHESEGGFGVVQDFEVQVRSGRRWKSLAKATDQFSNIVRLRFKATEAKEWRILVTKTVDGGGAWQPTEIEFVNLEAADFAALPAAEPDQKKINEAIDRGMAWLQKKQQADGNWASNSTKEFPLGVMSLAGLALRKSGLDRDDPVIQDLVKKTEALPKEKVYCVAVEAMFLRAVSKERYTDRLQKLADWLAEHQAPDGQWGYPTGRADLSNAQYALLGFKAAAEGGARVEQKAIEKAWDFVIKKAQKDGGFNYVAERKTSEEPTTGSMTAAALAIHHVCQELLPRDATRAKAAEASIEAAMQWLDARFVAEMNPGKGSSHYYYLYGVERVGAFFKLKTFNNFSWYNEGAQHLLDNQERDGSWRRGNFEDTCFALLFLNRASTTGD